MRCRYRNKFWFVTFLFDFELSLSSFSLLFFLDSSFFFFDDVLLVLVFSLDVLDVVVVFFFVSSDLFSFCKDTLFSSISWSTSFASVKFSKSIGSSLGSIELSS